MNNRYDLAMSRERRGRIESALAETARFDMQKVRRASADNLVTLYDIARRKGVVPDKPL